MTRAFLLLLTLTALGLTRHLAFDDDEFQHAHMARLISRGEVPHRDFFEHHLPLYHLLHAPLMAGDPGPERILTLRSVSVLWMILTLWLLRRTAVDRLGAESAGPLILLALSPVFFVKMIEVRPEGFALCCGALSLWALGGKSPRPVLAGLAAGAMVMASQKFVFLAAGLFLLCLLERPGRETLRFALAGAVFPLVPGTWYAAAGALPAAWDHLVVMNVNWKESFSPGMYGGLIWRTSGPLAALALVGWLAGTDHALRRASLVLTLAGLAGVLAVPIPFRQTFLMLFPGLFLAAAQGWCSLAERIDAPRLRRGLAAAFVAAGALPALAEIAREGRDSLAEDLEIMRRAERDTAGPVFDGRGLLFWRAHVGFYPWMHEGLLMMLDGETYARDTLEALERAGWPPLIRDYRVDLMPESLRVSLADRYVPPEGDDPFHRFGLRVDRSRLAGGAALEIPVSGRWLADWTGGSVTLEDETLEPGGVVTLQAGPARVEARGFVRNFTLRLLEARP